MLAKRRLLVVPGVFLVAAGVSAHPPRAVSFGTAGTSQGFFVIPLADSPGLVAVPAPRDEDLATALFSVEGERLVHRLTIPGVRANQGRPLAAPAGITRLLLAGGVPHRDDVVYGWVVVESGADQVPRVVWRSTELPLEAGESTFVAFDTVGLRWAAMGRTDTLKSTEWKVVAGQFPSTDPAWDATIRSGRGRAPDYLSTAPAGDQICVLDDGSVVVLTGGVVVLLRLPAPPLPLSLQGLQPPVLNLDCHGPSGTVLVRDQGGKLALYALGARAAALPEGDALPPDRVLSEETLGVRPGGVVASYSRGVALSAKKGGQRGVVFLELPASAPEGPVPLLELPELAASWRFWVSGDGAFLLWEASRPGGSRALMSATRAALASR